MARLGICVIPASHTACKLCRLTPWGLSKLRVRERQSSFLFGAAGGGRTYSNTSVFLLHNGTFQDLSLASPQVTWTSVDLSKGRYSHVKLSVVLSSPVQSSQASLSARVHSRSFLAPTTFLFLPRAALVECYPCLSWPYGSHHRASDGLPGER